MAVIKLNIGANLNEFMQGMKKINALGKTAGASFKKGFTSTPITPKINTEGVTKAGAAAGKKFGSGFSTQFKVAMGGMFAGNILFSVLSGVKNFVSEANNEFKALDTQVKNIGTLGFENFEKFNKLAVDGAKGLTDTSAVVAEGAYQAISAGVKGTAEEIMDFVSIASKAGVAGLTNTKAAVNAMTSVINAYGLEISESENVSSTFFAGIKLGKTTFEEMNASLSSFVPMASAMGVGFDQGTAAIARLTAMGTPTAMAGTQMNAVFTLLAKGTAPLNKALKNSGTDLNTLREKLAIPVSAGGGLVNVLRDIQVAADKSGVQVAALTGRVEAAKIITSMAGTADKAAKSLDVFGQVVSEVAGGAAGKAFEVASESIDVQFASVKNNIIAIIIDIQRAVFPVLISIGKLLVEIFNSPPFQAAIAAVKLAFTAIGFVVGLLVDNFNELLPVIIAIAAAWAVQNTQLIISKALMITTAIVTKAWTAAQWLLNIALNANPIGLIVIAIGLLVAGVILAYKNLEFFRDAVDAVWKAIKQAVQFIGEWLGLVEEKKPYEDQREELSETEKKYFDLALGIETATGEQKDFNEELKKSAPLLDSAKGKLAAYNDELNGIEKLGGSFKYLSEKIKDADLGSNKILQGLQSELKAAYDSGQLTTEGVTALGKQIQSLTTITIPDVVTELDGLGDSLDDTKKN